MSLRSGRLWDGKVAIVTGASSGIGREIAIEAAHAGARLVLVARNESRLSEVAEQCRATGTEAQAVIGDVRLSDTVSDAVSLAVGRFGAIDVLVPCAGVYTEESAGDELAQFDEQIETNLRAPYLLIRAALPHMRAGAAIVLISSHAATVGFPRAAGYCASKAGLEQLQKALTLELAPRGIRVNAVAPGIILTPLNAEAIGDPGYRDRLVSRIPIGRIGRPEDVAPAVIFLGSDAARYVCGASLLIEGGWTAQ